MFGFHSQYIKTYLVRQRLPVCTSLLKPFRCQFAFWFLDELQNATMFTAAAVAIRNVTDILEVRLDKDDIVQFLVNGKERDLTSSTSEFNGQFQMSNILH